MQDASAPNSPETVLEQHNSKNFMKCTLTDEGLLYVSGSDDNSSRIQFLFHETGLLTNNVDISTENEKTRPGMVSLYAGAAFFVAGLLIIGARSSMPDRSAAATLAYIALILMGIAGLFIYKAFQNFKVKMRGITFSQGYCNFYYRTPEERNEVDAFIKQIDERCSAYYKKLFLEALEKNPHNLESMLDVLYDKGVVTDAEYAQYQSTIRSSSPGTLNTHQTNKS